jgi:hypothetical protein
MGLRAVNLYSADVAGVAAAKMSIWQTINATIPVDFAKPWELASSP